MEKFTENCNKKLPKKYYKIKKNDKKFLGKPKMCSNYTSNLKVP